MERVLLEPVPVYFLDSNPLSLYFHENNPFIRFAVLVGCQIDGVVKSLIDFVLVIG